MARQYTTRVVLAAAHLDNDPGNNRLRNLRSLCQRCHLVHDRAWHLLQRWITYRLCYAGGDLFLGPYRHGRTAAQVMGEILSRSSYRQDVRKRAVRLRGEIGSREQGNPIVAATGCSLPRRARWSHAA
jgi:hypothetical protein